MKNLFLKHPHSIGETYFQHLKFASLSGAKLCVAGVACMIHAIFPFLFAKVASSVIKEMNDHMVRRHRVEPAILTRPMSAGEI